MQACLIRTHEFDAQHLPGNGNRFLIANGYLGVRGTLEEHGKEALAAVTLAGLYDRFGNGWREPVNAPHPFALKLTANGEPLALPLATPIAHTQQLDIRRGVHRRDTVYAGGVTFACERIAHMEHVHLLASQATVTAAQDGVFALAAAIDGDVWDIHGPHFRDMALQSQGELITALATTNEGDQVAVCARHILNCPHTRTDSAAGRTQTATFTFALKAGQTATLTMVAALYTGRDVPLPLAAAMEAVRTSPPYAVLMDTHAACWQRLWQAADIRIDGDADAERAMRYSAYHLLSIAPRHSGSLSVPARGLSGQTYKGAIFWDTEMFMLDFYLATLPDVAKTLMRYRIDTLDGARAKAREYGLRGAFYAWESQEGGVDACSDYNVTDVFTGRPMRTYFRDRQIHITAAVIYGLAKVARWTGDPALWLEGGAEVLIEAARFYHSLLVKRVTRESYELWDVIGPDEYHEHVNNNAYTNEMARFVWQCTLDTAAWLAREHPGEYARLETKLGFTAELPAFGLAIERLTGKAPRADGVIEQFDGYFDLEDTTVAAVRARLKDPREYWGGAYGVASQTQIIKQADVITLLFMLRERYRPDVVRANYEYYLPRTEHGSSLSACMYALAACAIGRPNDAYPLFLKSATADLADGGKDWAGLVYIGGTHPAAAGGAYMALLWGFLGATRQRDGLAIHPSLPDGWLGVRMTVILDGQPVTLACGSLTDVTD